MYRYSDRLAAVAASENSFSALLNRLRSVGRPLLDLTISNPTEALEDYPHAEIAAALGSIPHFRYQPDPFGDIDTRRAIIRRLGIDLQVEHLALTASTSEAYSLLFKLLANPGDEVLVPTPSYPLFDYLAHLESVNLRPYRLRYDGSWFIDFASLESAVSERTRAIILVNPNNPTGSFLKVSELAKLTDFAGRHNLPLISDEVFMDYAFAESADRVVTLNGLHDVLSFTLNGLSKGAGMPQMKLGWIGINGPLRERREACARLELILDTYLSVGAPVQLAAEQLFSIGDRIQGQLKQRVQENLSTLDKLLANTQVHRLHAEGGWSAILRVPQVMSEEAWATRLMSQHGVIVQPGYFFDIEGGAHLVVSLLPLPEKLEQGVKTVLDVAAGRSAENAE